MFATLWEAFVCIIEYGLFFALIYKKLDVRSKHRWVPLLFVIPMGMFVFFINGTGMSWGIQTVLFLCVDLLTVFALFKAPLMSYVFWGSACMLVSSIANSLVSFAFMIFPKGFVGLITMGYPYRLIGTSAYLIISALLYWYANRLPRLAGNFSVRDAVLFGFSFLLCTTQSGLAHQLINDTIASSRPVTLMYTLFLSGSNIIFIIFLTQLVSRGNAQNLQLENELNKKEYDRVLLQNKIMQDQLLHAVMHDYSNNISVLKGYAYMGDLALLKAHLDSLSTQLQDTRKEGPTGNNTFNASFNSRAMRADELDIPLSFEGYVPGDLNVNSLAFSTVIFNLLDNALEATSKLSPEKAWIRVTSHIEDNKLHIWVRNASNGVYTFRNGKLISSKGKNRNGFGLTRIHEHAEIIGGAVETFPNPDSFEALVIIPYEGEPTEVPPMEYTKPETPDDKENDKSSGLIRNL